MENGLLVDKLAIIKLKTAFEIPSEVHVSVVNELETWWREWASTRERLFYHSNVDRSTKCNGLRYTTSSLHIN